MTSSLRGPRESRFVFHAHAGKGARVPAVRCPNELALRVGKSEGYVLNRLKLNSLTKEAQKDIDDERLPFSYALEIAKYTPAIQKLIYDGVYRKDSKYKGNSCVCSYQRPDRAVEGVTRWVFRYMS